jgi:hypothetical protein
MLQVSLQIVAVVILTVLAIRIQLSLRRRRAMDWPEILSAFRNGHGHLLKLSRLSETQGREESSGSDNWSGINDVRGLWRMSSNLEVILDAIDFVRDNSVNVPETVQRLRQVRSDAMRGQLMIGALIVVRIRSRSTGQLARSTVATYLKVIYEVATVLGDACPNLVRSYRYFVTRESSSVMPETHS